MSIVKKIEFYIRNKIKIDKNNFIINDWNNKIRKSKMTLRSK